MAVVPNGIDVDRYRPDPTQRKSVRDEWGLSGATQVVGLVGRLDPMKDHPTFLNAASLLVQRRPDVRFVCVGDGPEDYRRQLVEQTRKLGLEQHVIWTGSRDDLPAVYNALDLATSTSAFGEGFPNVIGEALACGVPCVVTDVGDSARVVGEASRVVPAGDPERLFAAWDAVLGEPGGSAGSSRARVEREFSLNAMTTRTVSELRHVVGDDRVQTGS